MFYSLRTWNLNSKLSSILFADFCSLLSVFRLYFAQMPRGKNCTLRSITPMDQQSIRLGKLELPTSEAQEFSVTRLDYLISDFQLQRNGSKLAQESRLDRAD